MKETVLDVLMYLLDRYADEDDTLEPDREVLAEELSRAGFGSLEVDHAFDWLASLGDEPEPSDPDDACRPWSGGAMRVFSEVECQRLSVEARGFLTLLERSGLVDGASLERVVDRALALEGEDLDVDTIRWVALMVLCNQSQTAHLHLSIEALATPSEQRQIQ